MEMRKSRLLRQMRAGKVATCMKLNLADARNAEIAAMSGFDSIWIDLEHVPNDYNELENIIRAAKIYDCDTLTRVQRGSYSNYIRPLEADSAAIMVPHIMSLEDARQIVYYTKFHPVGRRPLDGGNADGKYCLVDGKTYMQQANEERIVMIQIEDPEPLKDLDAICALPGIDLIFFGPADFSQGIGSPLDFSNKLLIDTKKRVAETARKYGKFAGTIAPVEDQDMLIDMGYTFIASNADIFALEQYYSKVYSQVKDKNIKY